jgi:cyclopropane-fatty-acyl-phospholipid synthase
MGNLRKAFACRRLEPPFDKRCTIALSSVRTADRAVQQNLSFLQFLLEGYARDFAVRFWDGTCWEPEPGQPTRYTLVLNHPGAVRAMFWPPNGLTLGEAYIYNDFDVEGDLEFLWQIGIHLRARPWTVLRKFQFVTRLLRLPSERRPHVGGLGRAKLTGARHSQERDRQAVSFHYNASNDFYALWLDRRMVYTCAYFGTAEDGIDTAQERKLDHVCRKLRLRPGDRLLDAGCGWGALALHAARNYGADVLGVTLSQAQFDLATLRIREAGLADRCRVELMDYRNVRDDRGFDKIAAIGMLEHVGEAKLTDYFRKAWGLLRPGGVFLSHGIARNPNHQLPTGPTFFDRYVFPDGELTPINKNLAFAEQVGFEVRDVESLREHYLLTLRHWVRRLEENADEARRLTDDVTYRIWRLYMAISAMGFRLGAVNLYQTLLLKPHAQGDSNLPLTRADWYVG